MRQFIIILILIVSFIPTPVYAIYTVYLKNGSTIEDVYNYTEDDLNITLYLKMGSMVLDKKSVLKIEGSSEEVSKDTEIPLTSEEGFKKDVDTKKIESIETVNKKGEELDKIRTEIDSLNSEIRATEQKEMELITQINEKTGKRSIYNVYQLRRLESELEPLRQELYSVQQRKKELVQKRNSLENILKEQQ